MNEFRVIWSNRLEELAEEMLGSFETHPLDDPFQRECIVVNSRVAEGWLRHYAMYERRGRARQTVIANWDVQFLYAFINDALYRMHAGANAKREPRFHPCSRDVLRWRFHGLLGGDQLDHAAFAPLRDYLHGDGEPDPRRRFALAGTLAQLFDEYQVYRPDMLARWQKSQTGNLPDNTHWQPPLWEALRQQNADTYLKLFLEMGNRLPRCGVLDGLRRLSVFAVPGMPPVYLHFLKLLSEHVPVSLYLFNPCQELWDEDLAPKARERAEGKLRLQGREDEVPYLETGNPLLSSLGKACQSQLGEVLDFTGGNIAEPFHSQPDDCTLHVVQNDLLQRRWTDDRAGATLRDPFAVQSADESISIHICHSAMRELEVLRDQLLRWFSKEEHGLPGLQPRQIQVLCPNIEDYAPYIDAVFGTEPRQRRDPHTIPYVIADRTATGASPLANAFLALLALPESRFSATQVADLLQNEAVCAAFEIRGDEVQALRQWIHECGIRWGLDSEHRKRLSGADFTQVTTWRHGLDRMLLGYAMAPSGDETPDHAGTLGTILPFSKVEGDSGVLLGKLARFVNCLEETLNTLAGPVRLEVWGNRLDSVLDTFFANTNETYADLTATRNAIRALVRQSEAADFAEPVLAEVVLAFMREQLEQMDAPGNTIRNAVVFSALRPMHCMPRRVVWLLGMDNGVFPRPDIRASFDLMRQKCHRGDPSRRNDDRSAFLEALLAAREHFHISYVGRTDANELIPPSTLVCELREYLIAGFERADATDELPFPETQHRLQPFHPAYFGSDSALFSYSRADCQAARALQNSTGESFRFQEPPLPAVDQPPKVLLLRELTRFLRDPAAAFYRNALNVRFDDRDTTQLDDSELFEADTLQRYTIDNTILQAILSGSDSATLRDALEQKGTIPLGEAGAQWLEKRREEVEEFLDQPVPDDLHPGTIRELLEIPVREESIHVPELVPPPPGLSRSDAEPPVPPPPGLSRSDAEPPVPPPPGLSRWSDDCEESGESRCDGPRCTQGPPEPGGPTQGAYRQKRYGTAPLPASPRELLGSASLRTVGSRPIQIFCRFASIKPKDLLAAWIPHLALAAAGSPAHTLILGKKDNQSLPDLEPAEAADTLWQIVALFDQGMQAPLPFAPATSHAYAKRIRGKSGSEAKGRSAAFKAWSAGDYPERDSSVCLSQAFGEQGPMREDRFAEVAEHVFGTILGGTPTEPVPTSPESAPEPPPFSMDLTKELGL